MPTGYTAKLYEGEQSFDEFAWGVARDFGALIEMRDAPMDAPIPEEFQPSSYHADRIAEAEADLEAARTMSDEEIAKREAGQRYEAEQRRQKWIDDKRAVKERYVAMLERARAYEPPTPDHEGFKNTMVEQLERAIDFDCGGTYVPDVSAPMTVDEYRAYMIEEADRELAYHRKEYAKDVERAEQRTAWVRALRESLEGARA